MFNFKNKIYLAPMDKINTIDFRNECRKNGADVAETGLISCRAIINNTEKWKWELNNMKNEKNIGLQIFGSKPQEFIDAIKIINKSCKPDYIDINMCCPALMVVRDGAGAGLMRNRGMVEKVVRACKSSTTLPICVKIRSGWDEQHVNAVEIAMIIEKAGADAITIHPRTKVQKYEGKADWDIIKKIKDTVKIPVIGNGDITNFKRAVALISKTKCDSIMIGRAAMDDSEIFKELDYIYSKR